MTHNIQNTMTQTLTTLQQLTKQHHTIDKTALNQVLQQEQLHDAESLFADTVLCLNQATIIEQQTLITAIESVIQLPSYQNLVLENAPNAAQIMTKTAGVFLGYDFHLTPTGSQLIEINTNAGGALLNAVLLGLNNRTLRQEIEQKILAMFQTEWQKERGTQALNTIAIIDEQPKQQGLFVEFLLFKRLFEQHGFNTIICDAKELSYRNNALWFSEYKIDLVYNRLTDFYLEKPEYHALFEAYKHHAIVLTPQPKAHALYADKKNLAILTDAELLTNLGVKLDTIHTLIKGIAKTILVNVEDADILWAKRKQLFFKPRKGYGSKAVYRGDKLTKRVFSEILAGDYVAQLLVPPSECYYQDSILKVDLRQYAYQADILLTCGRLYQGQTTNFRTEGGGFAKVEMVSGECD